MHQPTQKTTFKRYATPNVDGAKMADFYQETVTTHINVDTGEEVVTARVPTALWGQTQEMLVAGLNQQLDSVRAQATAAEAEIQEKIDEINLL